MVRKTDLIVYFSLVACLALCVAADARFKPSQKKDEPANGERAANTTIENYSSAASITESLFSTQPFPSSDVLNSFTKREAPSSDRHNASTEDASSEQPSLSTLLDLIAEIKNEDVIKEYDFDGHSNSSAFAATDNELDSENSWKDEDFKESLKEVWKILDFDDEDQPYFHGASDLHDFDDAAGSDAFRDIPDDAAAQDVGSSQSEHAFTNDNEQDADGLDLQSIEKLEDSFLKEFKALDAAIKELFVDAQSISNEESQDLQHDNTTSSPSHTATQTV